MNILMVTIMPPQPRAWGAIPVLTHAQLSGLRDRHSVTLVTLAGPERQECAAVEELTASGLEVYPVLRSPAVGGWLRRGTMAASWAVGSAPKRTIWYREPGMQCAIDRAVATHRFDLIHVQDLAAGVYRLPPGLPKILTHQEVLVPRPVDWTAWRHRRPVHSIIRELDWHRWPQHQASIMRRFDRIHVFSRRDLASIETFAPDLVPRVRVNPFCLEVPPAREGGREESGALLFVGSFLHPPNVDAAVWLVDEIMPRLRVKHPGVRLMMVGDDPRGRVRHLAREDVCLAGFVPDLQPLLEKAAIVVAPVRIGGGQRMKVLQGMAAGKAVVTTSRGAEGLDMARERGALSIADDAEGFANAAASLLGSAPMRLELGRRARALVEEHYTPGSHARRLEAIYHEISGT